MKTKSKIILIGLLRTMILLVAAPAVFGTQLSETTIWTRLEGGAEKLTTPYDVTVDKNGNSYMVGDTNIKDTRNYNAFVSKYAANGTKLWTRQLGDDLNETTASGVVIDSTGNCYVTGFTDSDLDGIKLIGRMDTFIVKYKPDGTKEWLKLVGVPNFSTMVKDIAIDKANNIYITGNTDGKLNNQVLKGDTDLFIAKYNSAGVHQWTRLLGAKKSTIAGEQITVDNKSSNIYVAGYTTSSIDGQNIAIFIDGLVVKYDSGGNKK